MLLSAEADKDREVAAGFDFMEVISDCRTGCLQGMFGPNLPWSGKLESGGSDCSKILRICWAREQRQGSS